MVTSRHVPIIVGLLLVRGSSAESEAQKPDLTGVTIVTHQVAENVFMLEATKDVAGNIGVSAGPDGILLVDTQFAELAVIIRQALGGIREAEVKYIINSHYHDDHSDGNIALGENSTILGATNTRERLESKALGAKPVITFDEAVSLHFNGEEIKILHLPNGHTDTDVVVFFTGSNVVHLGDLYNAGMSSFPNVDLEAGGTIDGLVHNIASLVEMLPADVKIIPGHYELSDLAGLKACHRMLVETIDCVKTKKAAGVGLEAIQKEGLPAKYETWGVSGYTSASKWIENIYNGIE